MITEKTDTCITLIGKTNCVNYRNTMHYTFKDTFKDFMENDFLMRKYYQTCM